MTTDPKPHLLDPWFHCCLAEAANNRELIREFDRLYGHNLSRRGAPLDLLVDDASGRMEVGVAAFCEFVRECVYERCPRPEPRSENGLQNDSSAQDRSGDLRSEKRPA